MARPERWAVAALALLVPAAFLGGSPASPRTVNVRQFGAVGDGRTPDTEALNRAIAACADLGGGTVIVPRGTYLTGTVRLRSYITLRLERGARILGSQSLADYAHFQPPKDTFEGRMPLWHRALVLGDGETNIHITGEGIIDGASLFDPQGEERMRGPHTVLFGHCKDVAIDGITVVDSANYAFLLEGCSRVRFDRVRIRGGWDGIHFRGWPNRPCTDFRITRCDIRTGDDAIAGRYWERVLIEDCRINSSCNGLRLIGPATDLTVRKTRFWGPGEFAHRSSGRTNMLAAVNLQPGAWDPTRGHMDRVMLEDLEMRRVATPFFIMLRKGNTAGLIRAQRVRCVGAYLSPASVESWAEEPFRTVVFRDVSIEYTPTAADSRLSPPIREPGVDARPLPVWGLYLRGVQEADLQRVRMRVTPGETRAAMLCEQVGALLVDGRQVPLDAGGQGQWREWPPHRPSHSKTQGDAKP